MSEGMADDAAGALSGATIRRIEAEPRELRVGVQNGPVVCLSAAGDESDCRLETLVQPGASGGEGNQIYPEFAGRKIVRVSTREQRISLHFADGELLHLETVVNEDGCRMAARSELEHARGPSSFLDRAIGLLRRGSG